MYCVQRTGVSRDQMSVIRLAKPAQLDLVLIALA